MKSKLSVLVLVVVLTALAATPIAAAPLASACAPGAAYNPTCDVNQDGAVNVLDVQLTAGHWNQTGTFTSDNNHNHLGQTWTGSNNPLKIQGAFGAPDNAGLVLSNSASTGTGLRIATSGMEAIYVDSAGTDGVYVRRAGNPSSFTPSPYSNGFEVAGAQGNGLHVGRADGAGVRVLSAGFDGVYVDSAASDGVHVGVAGNPSSNLASTESNGFEVAGAQGHGLFVGRADREGVHVNSAGYNGVYVDSTGFTGFTVYTAGTTGVNVHSAGGDGLYVGAAGGDGVDVFGTAYAGNFLGNIYVSGNCIGCLQANFALNAGGRALEPGDVVSIQAVTPTDFDTGSTLWQVAPAQPAESLPSTNAGAVVGVVAGRAELVIEEEHRPGETGKRLVPREGAAQPGEYVTIVYSGPMQVKATVPIAAGEKLTVDDNGNARGLRKTEVNGFPVAEDAPVLGIALSESQDGLVWVLVNPQ